MASLLSVLRAFALLALALRFKPFQLSIASTIPADATGESALRRRAVTPSGSGTLDGYYWYWRSDGQAAVADFTNWTKPPGSFK